MDINLLLNAKVNKNMQIYWIFGRFSVLDDKLNAIIESG